MTLLQTRESKVPGQPGKGYQSQSLTQPAVPVELLTQVALSKNQLPASKELWSGTGARADPPSKVGQRHERRVKRTCAVACGGISKVVIKPAAPLP